MTGEPVRDRTDTNEDSQLAHLGSGDETTHSNTQPLLQVQARGSVADGPAQMQKLRILSEIAPDAIPPNMVGRLVV